MQLFTKAVESPYDEQLLLKKPLGPFPHTGTTDPRIRQFNGPISCHGTEKRSFSAVQGVFAQPLSTVRLAAWRLDSE